MCIRYNVLIQTNALRGLIYLESVIYGIKRLNTNVNHNNIYNHIIFIYYNF